MSYEEEDTCVSYGIHVCHMRRRIHVFHTPATIDTSPGLCMPLSYIYIYILVNCREGICVLHCREFFIFFIFL